MYYYIRVLIVLILGINRCDLLAGINLESHIQDFVLETKQIKISGYPTAFNPSIIPWKGKLLMTFRDIPDPKQPYISNIGVVWLNEQFEPVSLPQLLDLAPLWASPQAPSRSEDARLIEVKNSLYMVYSDNRDEKISKGGFRVYLAELQHKEGKFFGKNIEVFTRFEGESQMRREKSWVPFVYQDELLLAYSLSPHRILRPLIGTGECETFSNTVTDIPWKWGELRGGTPGLPIDNKYYLSFFHSSKKIKTVHSENEEVLHYFIGAYTYSLEPPFEILQISPEPIIGKNFYVGETYKPYWHPVRAVFPGGYIYNENFIWIVYGRQDHEMWVIKLDKKKLLSSLFTLRN